MTAAKKALNVFVWIVINGLFAALIVSGIVYHTHWALNIARFMTWVGFILYGICMMAKHSDEGLVIPEKVVPLWIDIVYDFGIACLFAAGGHFFYAALVVISIIFYVDVFHKDDVEVPAIS